MTQGTICVVSIRKKMKYQDAFVVADRAFQSIEDAINYVENYLYDREIFGAITISERGNTTNVYVGVTGEDEQKEKYLKKVLQAIIKVVELH